MSEKNWKRNPRVERRGTGTKEAIEDDEGVEELEGVNVGLKGVNKDDAEGVNIGVEGVNKDGVKGVNIGVKGVNIGPESVNNDGVEGVNNDVAKGVNIGPAGVNNDGVEDMNNDGVKGLNNDDEVYDGIDSNAGLVRMTSICSSFMEQWICILEDDIAKLIQHDGSGYRCYASIFAVEKSHGRAYEDIIAKISPYIFKEGKDTHRESHLFDNLQVWFKIFNGFIIHPSVTNKA
ncbi:unnamed protein product [Vicia faba]|uniref:Uncharacterized protein n=1 Tax=Vicia faba TaxID=3906 RepID=A0AAV0YHY3_VICFA|nr:unnamed protein product [Vicia faba]